ncbi:uncharacterized protein CTHT_0063290 [Thermochaetoides thermophila DSM 1495]|uniref:Protein kinase domain-containing protein n=1 Tax=Chaetomium thermophilum (strain DSM 1495 / CBS 144.50 / IMI 039719) TaxID=759272 RepID=G0SEC8_CHATD|nr:hypothetical protein CTHT_0063290 [Thermochaetoides thermophila DSM 1495]EGS18305.1 hypothetical protein CTHT_0063290 [Thermochaetoides thermophila DSM 1495]
MSYSSTSGGTLTLPSPTHPHNVDVSSAVRSLRRSLSRSPSKFRLSSTASPTLTSTPMTSSIFRQPLTPAPTDRSLFSDQPGPATGASSTPIPATPAGPAEPSSPKAAAFTAPPPLPAATPLLRSNIKLSLRSTRSAKPITRPLGRQRLSPRKSPLKRVFGPAPDSGNPIPSASSSSSSSSDCEDNDQENLDLPSGAESPIELSPTARRSSERRSFERANRLSFSLESNGSGKSGMAKFLDNEDKSTFPSISVSPLKRSDAAMSVDQPTFGSPVAKRRSLHGISGVSNGVSVFDQNPASTTPTNMATKDSSNGAFDTQDDGNQEYRLTGTTASPFRDPVASPTPTVMPKRTSSLRKSTLQQRLGESRGALSRRAGEKQISQLADGASTPIPRNRLRLSLDHYTPTEERVNLFGSPAPSSSLAQPAPRPANQPHPLSRSLTQSSSSSSQPDDSPTHVPVSHIGERPRVPLNFSKSLPPGSQRPTSDSQMTPQYKQAKPLQSAFLSTGLVSKMNRNPDLLPPKHSGFKMSQMPDTPCKKQPYNSNTFPPQGTSGGRRQRISLGSPSTPFSGLVAPIRENNPFGSQDKSGSFLFQQVRNGPGRKSSVLSLDGDELVGSHDDFPPPTPTKNVLFNKSSTTPVPSARDEQRESYTPFGTPVPGFGLGRIDDTPSKIGPTQKDRAVEGITRPTTPFSGASPSLSFSLGLNNSRSQPASFATPAPNRTGPASFGVFGQYTRNEATKTPLGKENRPPQTPQDGSVMPDPCSRSISARPPPATPTGSQPPSLFSSVIDRRLSVTPQNRHGPVEVDESLMSRFDKSELIGSGEFSQVYRVVKASAPSMFLTGFSTTPRTPSSPDDNSRVFAVKKLKLPFHSAREREAKMKEVHILQTLSHSSKIVQFIDSWEHNGHLYIQTEYCSEGSLDAFLREIGQCGRLDDFRIWKILLETTQGLMAIHQAGFIHLDIKPANIFITFDGYLKIGDFGMATSWPAPKGIEGEGDREYIGPEILLGQYDKPADIFALGLIILEIACNVFLPDNGPTWQALRNGDMSVVPPLTPGEAGAVLRDANGVPICNDSGVSMPDEDSSFAFKGMTHDASNLFGSQRRPELREPPPFLADPNHPHSLDNLVKWMIQPNPKDRPTAEQLLASEPVTWISSRRAAGATVFEGNWGPQVGPSVQEGSDTEMTGV